MRRLFLAIVIMAFSINEASAQATTGNSFADSFDNSFRNAVAARSARAAEAAAATAKKQARGWDWDKKDPWFSKETDGRYVINFRGKDEFDFDSINFLSNNVEVDAENNRITVDTNGKGSRHFTYVYSYKIHKDNIVLIVDAVLNDQGINIFKKGKRNMPRNAFRYLSISLKNISNDFVKY